MDLAPSINHLLYTLHVLAAELSFCGVCVCVLMYVCVFMYVQVHAEVRGQYQVSFLGSPPPCFLREHLLLAAHSLI